MLNNPCPHQPQKTFTIESIEELNNQNNTQKQNLLLKLYLNFLLLSEVLEEEQECEVTFEQYGFFVNNQHKIEFKEYCFLNANNNQIKYIDEQNNILHQKESAENELYYCPKNNKWVANADITKAKPSDVDELYFKGKKQATDIYYIPLDNNAKVEDKNPKTFKNRDEQTFPIGVKYYFRQIDNIVLYVNYKDEVRFAKELSSQEQEELAKLNLYSKKRSSFVYKDSMKKSKAKREDIEKISKFQSNLKIEEIVVDGKRVKVKSVFYLGEESSVDVTINPLESRDSGVYYCYKKIVYKFQNAHVIYISKFTNKQKYICLKQVEIKKKDNIYTFEANIKAIFNKEKENYEEEFFNKKCYRNIIGSKKYKILYKDELYIKTIETENNIIHYKKSISFLDIDVDIFLPKSNIDTLEVKQNHILMVDPKKYNNLYRNILYRFRNSIAHGEFNMLEDEITFCNSHHEEINFKARISMDKIDALMGFLKGKVIVDD